MEESSRIISAVRDAGVDDDRVIEAMRTTARSLFISDGFAAHLDQNQPLPIGLGQTISQPSLVGLMTQMLQITDRHKILEIGTGSGYQTIILAKLARRVYTIERHAPLLQQAQARFLHFNCQNIVTRLGDGHKGWPEQNRFDRILVTAAAQTIPDALVEQLGPQGLMIAPIGAVGQKQNLNLYQRDAHGKIISKEIFPVRFVPLIKE